MNDLELTPEERKIVLDYADRIDRQSRHWRKLRWVAILCFVVGIGLLIVTDRVSARMRSAFELHPEALKVREQAGADSMTTKLESLATHMDAQILILRMEFMLVLKALIYATIGTSLFVYVMSDWRRDARDKVFAKVLRSLISAGWENRDDEPK
jgi:hypothetical protein